MKNETYMVLFLFIVYLMDANTNTSLCIFFQSFTMGNSESSTCGSDSSSACHGGGGFVVAHDGKGFSIEADRDGHFTVSAGGREASTRDPISSDRYVANMLADRKAPVTEHVHRGSLAMSAAVDVMNGGGPDGTSMRHDAGHFHSHTHDPVRVKDVYIGQSRGPTRNPVDKW